MLNEFFQIFFNLILAINNPNQITICTLNMENFGAKSELVEEKARSFSSSIQKAGCDIVGLQEISNVRDRFRNLELITKELPSYGFSIQQGTSIQLLGYLFKKKYKPDFKNLDLELPKLYPLEQQSDLKRIPYQLTLNLGNQKFTVINVHWKSRAGQDSSGFHNEVLRLREGIALRKVIPKTGSVILGDFNSNPDSVSVQSLFLELKLNEFKFREDSVILDYPIRLDRLYFQPSLYYKNKYGYSDYFILSEDLKSSKASSYEIKSDHRMLNVNISLNLGRIE